MTRASTAAERPPDLLDLAWRVSGAPLTGVVLCAALALLLAAAALIPQQPAGLSAGAAERWLAAAIARYGGLGPSLAALGAFNILHGSGLAVLLALFAYHLLVRLATGANAAWRLLRLPPGLPPAGPAPKLVPLVASVDEAGRRTGALFAAYGYGTPVTVLSTPGHTVLFGCRRRLGVLGPVAAQAGALLILAALLINTMAGWTSSGVALAPGSVAPLHAADGPGATAGVQARLEALSGPENDPLATVLLSQPDGQQRTVYVGAARPAAWGSLWLAQRASGPALAVSAQDESGHAVLLQAQPGGGRAGEPLHLLFTTVQSEQVFAVPERNIAFRVVNYPGLPGQATARPTFLVEAYRGSDSTPALSQLVSGPVSLALDGVTYTVAPERHIVLAASFWPGIWLLILGGLALLAGLGAALWWDQRSAWITLVAEGHEVLALVRVVAWLRAERERDRLAAALTSGETAP
ncbi:MAG TPA: hypothetical protein VGA61_06375 [Anaerolineae bacterium]